VGNRQVENDGGLLGLEEENRAVAEVEVDEMLGFCVGSICQLGLLSEREESGGGGRKRTVGDEASKIPPDYAVPSWAFPLIELWGIYQIHSIMG
jgi:hypothetical protein